MKSFGVGRIITSLLSVGLLMTATGPAVAAPVKRAAVIPENDAFYTPPTGYESAPLGSILRTRPVPNQLAAFSLLPQNIAAAWQILYRTSDSSGNAQATVTTVIQPHNANASRVLSYQVAEDSAYEACAPSYSLQKGTSLDGIVSQAELLFMDAALSNGWYVVTPDYEGPNGSFTAGLQAGHATLDSIRAVLASNNVTGVNANADVALWGYSGGALASGWAAELQPSYAPDLRIIGAALGGTPADLNATLNAVNKGPFVGLVPAGILGLASQYPDLAAYVDSILLPSKKADFYKAKTQCLATDIIQFAFQDYNTYVNATNFLDNPIATKALTENHMGKFVPKIPLHMYHAINDEVVPFAPAKELYTQYCAAGANIDFVADELSEHIILMITGSATAISWLEDRFNGVAAQAGCSNRTTATSALDPGAAKVFGQLIFDDLGALLGAPIGPISIT
ncbi:secretory lipase [Umbelopsis sp. PMI_123]|nr:secretory lipase [Umbelopsis sp. PMI_123]